METSLSCSGLGSRARLLLCAHLGLKPLKTVKRGHAADDDDDEVQSGHFAFGPLMQHSADLNPGEYHVEIIMRVQPIDPLDAVRERRSGRRASAARTAS